MARNVVTTSRLSNTQVITKTTAGGFEVFRAEGVKEAIDKLDNIIDFTKASALKEVFMEGALIVKQEVIANAPEPWMHITEKGWKSIRDAVFMTRGTPEAPNVLVGVSHQDAPQGLWSEYGTLARYTRKTRSYRGEMPPRPFFRPAINAVRNTVAEIIAAGIKKIVDDAAA